MHKILPLSIFVALAIPAGYAELPAPRTAATQLCIVSDERINEASGIAMSKRQPDAVWMHNDSGDSARLFLVGLDGVTRGVVNLRETRALDWEDMCSFAVDGTPWLLVGDIGDNAVARKSDTPGACRLLLFPEPDMKGLETLEIDPATIIRFGYEDGSHNCESVAVDVERGEILLTTKTKFGTQDVTSVYRMPLSLEPGTITATAQRIADVKLPTATAMDISPDGRQMVIINGMGAVYALREAGESWADALNRKPRILGLPARKQGESVCFGRTPNELLLNSEHTGQPLWSVTLPSRTQEPAPEPKP